MQKKVGLNSDMRVYFDMDGTIAKWCDVPVEESRKPGYYADLEPETELLSSDMRKVTLGHQVKLMSAELGRIRSWFPAMIMTCTPGMVENR